MPEEILHIDPSKMDSLEKLRSVVLLLLNAVDSLSAENAALKKEVQELKDTTCWRNSYLQSQRGSIEKRSARYELWLVNATWWRALPAVRYSIVRFAANSSRSNQYSVAKIQSVLIRNLVAHGMFVVCLGEATVFAARETAAPKHDLRTAGKARHRSAFTSQSS